MKDVFPKIWNYLNSKTFCISIGWRLLVPHNYGKFCVLVKKVASTFVLWGKTLQKLVSWPPHKFGFVVEIKSVHNDIPTFCCRLLMHTAEQCVLQAPGRQTLQKIVLKRVLLQTHHDLDIPCLTLSLVVVKNKYGKEPCYLHF